MSKLEQDPPEPEQSPETTQSAENAKPPPKQHTSTTDSMSNRTSRKEEPSIFGRDLLAFIAVFVCIFAVLTYRQFGPRKMLAIEDVELPVIGIDLGMEYSSVGVHTKDGIVIIPDAQGNRRIPSWVSFTDKEILVGEPAKEAYASNKGNTVYEFNRLIGRSMDDPALLEDIRHLTYKVVDRSNKPFIQVDYRGKPKEISPEEISSMVLMKLKETAETYLGHSITHVVITIPAKLHWTHRSYIVKAARLAGLNPLRIIMEPTAAGIALGLNALEGEMLFLVYNVGEKMVDVCVLSVDDGVFEILGMGEEKWVGGPKDLVKRSRELSERVLRDANIKKEDVQEFILIGGSAHIPKIQAQIKDYLNKGAFGVMDPAEVVVRGAAIQAGILSEEFRVHPILGRSCPCGLPVEEGLPHTGHEESKDL